MGIFIDLAHPSNRRRGYDPIIKLIAPAIHECQRAGIVRVREIADALNADEVRAPSGGKWTYTSMHRAITRAASLGLAAPVQSIADAATARPVSYLPRSRFDETSSKWIGDTCNAAKRIGDICKSDEGAA